MLKEKLADQFEFLRAKAPPLIGVDISSSFIKMVEIVEVGSFALGLKCPIRFVDIVLVV